MVDYRNIDMLIDEDPAYSQDENIDRRIAENERQYEKLKNFSTGLNTGLNTGLKPMIGEGTPLGVASDFSRDLLLQAGKQIAQPINYVAKKISSPDVTVGELQKIARTNTGMKGLKAQIQVPFEMLGETAQFLFDPKDYSDLQEKIKAGTSTQMEENLGAIAGAFEVIGGADLVKYIYKKFGPEVAQMITKTPGNNSRELIQNLDIPFEQKKIVADLIGGKKPKGFALGGTAEDYTQNVDLMSDRFMKDPAFEQEDAFAKSLEGATAFNPLKLHKLFKKSPGVATPKNLREVGLYNQLVDTQNMGGADVGIETLLPTVKPISDNDFAFKSFTVDKLNSTAAPKNATPESWRQFLKGGELQAPESELLDSGMEDFFIDSDKMYPGRKISREQLIDI